MPDDIKCPYSARPIEIMAYGSHQRIGVFDGETQIGEYSRNYSIFYRTFYPFQQGDQWLALYSPDYTSSRLMSLPDCKDIGGESRDTFGFCPVEFYVPEITARDIAANDPEPRVANHQADVWATKVAGGRWYWPDDKDGPEYNAEREQEYLKAKKESHAASNAWCERNPYVTRYAPWGFVCGCVWGDDTSWKIQFLDLSQASQGVLKRDERFGYIWLPGGVTLKDAISTWNFEHDNQMIEIALPVRFKLDGTRIPDED